MTLYRHNFYPVSPMLLSGAERLQWRAASVRGQLRYWYRAALGASLRDTRRVWEAESAVFGSTNRGSSITVRMFNTRRKIKESKFALMPHRSNRRFPQPVIDIGNRARLDLVTRVGQELPQGAETALNLWALLGGLGKRSRRMFGGFKLEGEAFKRIHTIDAYRMRLQETLEKIEVDNTLYKGQIPDFPTLHPDHAFIIVGQRTFDYAEDAMVTLFHDLLRSQRFRPDENSFGSARGGRRASPVIAQLREYENELYPILTIFRSKPDRDINWEVVSDFAKAAVDVLDGEIVWGGW